MPSRTPLLAVLPGLLCLLVALTVQSPGAQAASGADDRDRTAQVTAAP